MIVLCGMHIILHCRTNKCIKPLIQLNEAQAVGATNVLEVHYVNLSDCTFSKIKTSPKPNAYFKNIDVTLTFKYKCFQDQPEYLYSAF